MHFSTQQKEKFPHTFIILFLLVFLSSILTYLIPAGQFERTFNETIGQTLVIPGSYVQVEQSPVAPWLILHKFYEALCLPKTASIMWLILITGGSFQVIMKAGCIPGLCSRALTRFKDRALWVIPIFVVLFSVFGFTMGLTTASVVFAPLGIAVAEALGLDRLSGMAMIALGVNAGFTAGVFNPFSVGTAQEIAELALFSGAWLRWLTLPILIAISSAYIMYYAKRHRKTSVDNAKNFNSCSNMSHPEKCSLAVFAAGFLLLTGGITFWNWGTADIVVAFLIIGVLVGLSAGMTLNNICDIFLSGCRKMMKGVLVIGIAATMRLILIDGNILDTITYELTELVYLFPAPVQLMGMYLFNALLNFFVTSGSAKAALVMPILTPMADSLGLSRQAAVYAFQMGDGLTNLGSPISTTLNGAMAVSEITYGKWIKFYVPLIGLYLVVGALLILFVGIIGY